MELVVPINGETACKSTQEAWRLLRLNPNDPQARARLVQVLAQLVARLHTLRPEEAERSDALFALCVIADPAHLTPVVLTAMLAEFDDLDWLLGVCAAEEPTFHALHARCFSACLLARMFQGLQLLAGQTLPGWCSDDQQVSGLMEQLTFTARHALGTLASDDFHDRLRQAPEPEGIWSAVACPGLAEGLFDLFDDSKRRTGDALLASVAYWCTLAISWLALAYAWSPGADQGLLARAAELPGLLEDLRTYTRRPLSRVKCGPLHSCSLISEMMASMSFPRPRDAAKRFSGALKILRPLVTDQGLRDAMDVLSEPFAQQAPAPAQQAPAPAQQAPAPAQPAAIAGGAPVEGPATPELEGPPEADLVAVPGMVAAMLARTAEGAPEADRAQRVREAMEYALPTVEAPDATDRQLDAINQEHELLHSRGQLPYSGDALMGRMAPGILAALNAPNSPEACLAMATNIMSFFGTSYNPMSALGTTAQDQVDAEAADHQPTDHQAAEQPEPEA